MRGNGNRKFINENGNTDMEMKGKTNNIIPYHSTTYVTTYNN